jgi:hypothetical protein
MVDSGEEERLWMMIAFVGFWAKQAMMPRRTDTVAAAAAVVPQTL